MIDILGPATRNKFAEFLGRDPHPSGADHKIWHMSNARYPQFRFEWHSQIRRVYLVRQSSNVGEPIALDIETHGDAINAVNIWMRGFAEGQTVQLGKS